MQKYFPQFYFTAPTGGGAPVPTPTFQGGALIANIVLIVVVVALAVRLPFVKKVVKPA